MIYQILRWITQLAIHIYYRRIEINRPELLGIKGPLIIMSNHPNTLMDPLILAALFKHQVGFLANASIFVNSMVNRVFRYLQVIPVYRQQDLAPGQVLDNTKSFGACYQHLEKNGSLMIFPEGSSIHELKLRKIKTGGIRIAFGAEDRNDFDLGIQILAVGLYYSNPLRFRSKVYLNFGEPFTLKNYQENYQKDEINTVQTLTAQLRKSMEELTIHIPDEGQEKLFIQIKKLFKKELTRDLRAEQNQIAEFNINREISSGIRFISQYYPESFDQLKDKINTLDQLDEQLHVKSNFERGRLKQWMLSFVKILSMLLGLPFYLFGVIHNYIPYRIPRILAEKITHEKEYHASVSMVIGIFIFPLFYGIYLWSLTWIFSPPPPDFALALYFILMAITGLFSYSYYRFALRNSYFLRIVLSASKKDRLQHFLDLKKEVKRDLDWAKTQYVERNKNEK
ncbi:1-acyl-sn-glycerol-3-phosphate acyltransferase [Reichenbachiella ulvae]|uniref:1-acyl-sn-glycerol-3-phosphate acyltransferase n=1 Tax=Reichenbachiella ulvae TaxID=2980104 RepID=A0ABT3D0S9_9BACT|nr:1-acyl-sn-glycerol-3-phosphate acyltransferase [Reichenbachiella ulvae]MCV9389429.1 1-acyl-sn-glycerol-3-phosphate acyltransferase [Reichenbachiella ulvae]